MAYRNDTRAARAPKPHSNSNNPNTSPYNSVTSFKYFDNTVVSAYEVGIRKGIAKRNCKPPLSFSNHLTQKVQDETKIRHSQKINQLEGETYKTAETVDDNKQLAATEIDVNSKIQSDNTLANRTATNDVRNFRQGQPNYVSNRIIPKIICEDELSDKDKGEHLNSANTNHKTSVSVTSGTSLVKDKTLKESNKCTENHNANENNHLLSVENSKLLHNLRRKSDGDPLQFIAPPKEFASNKTDEVQRSRSENSLKNIKRRNLSLPRPPQLESWSASPSQRLSSSPDSDDVSVSRATTGNRRRLPKVPCKKPDIPKPPSKIPLPNKQDKNESLDATKLVTHDSLSPTNNQVNRKTTVNNDQKFTMDPSKDSDDNVPAVTGVKVLAPEGKSEFNNEDKGEIVSIHSSAQSVSECLEERNSRASLENVLGICERESQHSSSDSTKALKSPQNDRDSVIPLSNPPEDFNSEVDSAKKETNMETLTCIKNDAKASMKQVIADSSLEVLKELADLDSMLNESLIYESKSDDKSHASLSSDNLYGPHNMLVPKTTRKVTPVADTKNNANSNSLNTFNPSEDSIYCNDDSEQVNRDMIENKGICCDTAGNSNQGSDESSSLFSQGAKSDIEKELDAIVNSASESLKLLSEKTFFNFDNAVIQDLTDSVMGRTSACSEPRERLETQQKGTNNHSIGEKDHINIVTKVSDTANEIQSKNHFGIEDKSKSRKCNTCSEETKKDREVVKKSKDFDKAFISKQQMASNDKLRIEGRSFDGKEDSKSEGSDTSHRDCDRYGHNEELNNSGDSVKPISDSDKPIRETDKPISNSDKPIRDSDKSAEQEISKPITKVIESVTSGSRTEAASIIAKQKVKVERTPSYRRKVMARAKSRYGSRRSKNLKECSCIRKENGDIEMCQFCQNYEIIKQRSQTSLGNVTAKTNSDLSDSECSEISSPRRAFTPGLPPSGQNVKSGSYGSQRGVKKVQVSSRVDVLLSSGLFKKHLEKHEDLINKQTMSGKRHGLRKSISNLDLTEGLLFDSDQSFCENESEAGSHHDNNIVESHDLTVSNQRPRRFSLTGESESSLEKFQLHKSRKRQQRCGTLPISFGKSSTRPPIPSFTDNRKAQNHNVIPSFNEFRKRKEHEGITTEIADPVNSLGNEQYNKTFTDAQYIVDDLGSPNLDTIIEIEHKGSKENLICITQNNETNDLNEQASDKNITQKDRSKDINEMVDSKHIMESNSKVLQHKNSLVKQKSASEYEKRHARARPKFKSRTLSNLQMDAEGHYLSTGDLSDTMVSPSGSMNEKHRHGAKRPRSVLSTKSSMLTLTHEPDLNNDKSSENSYVQENLIVRPKLRVQGLSTARSKSDSRYESQNKRDNSMDSEIEPKGGYYRLNVTKGYNFAGSDVSSQCSTQDVGESETSTSVAGSTLSDSIRSEIANEDMDRLCEVEGDDADFEIEERSKLVKDDSMAPVLRSTSDACEITPEAARKRRERKERPYKSDPFSGTEIIPASKRYLIREERARLRQHRSSKQEILTFLDGVSHGDMRNGDSFPSLEELNEDDEQNLSMSDVISETGRKHRKHLSNVSSLSTDSGVIGQDGSHGSQQSSPSNTLTHALNKPSHAQLSSSMAASSSWKRLEQGRRSFSASCSDLTSEKSHENCVDCGHVDKHEISHAINMDLPLRVPHLCPHCSRRRIERKKTIQEIFDTETNYGRDLLILKEEFYIPMMKAGLLNQDQLDSIFLNLEELIHIHKHFTSKLKSAINAANQSNDDDLQELTIGGLFLESSTMFLTFENYCVNQAQAPVLLEQLEKDKQLLRIFLHVSQSDNTLLRRMHLKSFLMVPVQRIMKYPLLLDRLYKATPNQHLDKDKIKEAKEKIEDILGHINAKSKTTIVKQRKSSEKHYSVTEKMEVSRVALETLRWNRKDVCDVITTRLQITQPLDHLWASKKCKNYKFTNVHGVLLSLLQSPYDNADNNMNRNHNENLNNNNNSRTQHSAVVLSAVVFIREKNGKYTAAREPFMLDKCVVSQDPDYMDVFEILEWNKESCLIKADNPSDTKLWVQNLRQQMCNLGCWRKRRNALPNILLNHLA